MFRTCSKLPRRLQSAPPGIMLYSQALNGGHQTAPSSSSSHSTTKTRQDTITTTTTPSVPPIETTKRNHTKSNYSHSRSQPRPHHQPKPDHKPNTTTQETSVYVLTLTTTPSLTDPLTALRRSHFPRHMDRGNLPAHLTMFHALPGSEMQHITASLDELCAAQQSPLQLATGNPFRMRRGVGIGLADDVAARRLHAELQRRWWGFLSAQDRRRPWRPHWTVQNKAADEAAVDAAMDEVRAGFRGAEGLATGCALWRYENGGRWVFERGFDFDGDK